MNEKGFQKLRVYKSDDIMPKLDVIAVSVNYAFEQIKNILSKKVSYPIISIEDVTFGAK